MNKFIIYTSILLTAAPLLIANNPSDSSHRIEFTINEIGAKTHVSSTSNNFTIYLDYFADNGMLAFDFISETSICQVSTTNSLNAPDCTFTGAFMDAMGHNRSSRFSSRDLSEARFTELRKMNINPDFADQAIQALKELPKSNPTLSRIAAIGLTLMDPVCSKNARNIAGIFYASEYWGCVLGGGGWMECGDVARGKWGYN